MAHEIEGTGFLLKGIPPNLLMPEQDARWCERGDVPTYKLLRKPISVQELSACGHGIAIWVDTGALVYVSPHGTDDIPDTRQLVVIMEFGKVGPTFHIVGRGESGVSRTAAYIMSLKDATEETTYLRIYTRRFFLDFSAAETQGFERLFEVAPSRCLQLQNMLLSAEQSVVLATRSHPVQLMFDEVEFEDEGDEFVDELENRQLLFGSLTIDRRLLSIANLRRLLQTDKLDHLGLPCFDRNDELGLLALSAQVDSLECRMFSSEILEDAIPSLNIVAKKISFSICGPSVGCPTEISLFLQRVAELGHFVELKVGAYGYRGDIPESVVQELIHAALANRDLIVLDISSDAGEPNWDPHVATLFKGLKHHNTLRVLKLSVLHDVYEPYLYELVSHKRDLVVIGYD